MTHGAARGLDAFDAGLQLVDGVFRARLAARVHHAQESAGGLVGGQRDDVLGARDQLLDRTLEGDQVLREAGQVAVDHDGRRRVLHLGDDVLEDLGGLDVHRPQLVRDAGHEVEVEAVVLDRHRLLTQRGDGVDHLGQAGAHVRGSLGELVEVDDLALGGSLDGHGEVLLVRGDGEAVAGDGARDGGEADLQIGVHWEIFLWLTLGLTCGAGEDSDTQTPETGLKGAANRRY